jgi:hypothetical protein
MEKEKNAKIVVTKEEFENRREKWWPVKAVPCQKPHLTFKAQFEISEFVGKIGDQKNMGSLTTVHQRTVIATVRLILSDCLETSKLSHNLWLL